MDYETSRTSDAPVMNALQVIFLDIALTVGLLAALKVSGTGWLMAFVCAWVGGCLLTIAAVFVIYKVALMSEQKVDAPADTRSAVMPAKVADAIQVWETDRLMELDLTAQAGSAQATHAGHHRTGATPTTGAEASDVPDHAHGKRANGT